MFILQWISLIIRWLCSDMWTGRKLLGKNSNMNIDLNNTLIDIHGKRRLRNIEIHAMLLQTTKVHANALRSESKDAGYAVYLWNNGPGWKISVRQVDMLRLQWHR